MTDLSGVNLNRLVVFAAVVEAGSLTAAADRLGIAKTMVSTHMQRLEAEVGASLLVRTTRRVSVTEAGHAFYAASRQILSTAEDAISALAQGSGELRGTLRVATPIDYGTNVIAPMLAGLRRTHPELKVELVSADRMVDLVAESVDVAIRLGRLADSSYRAVKIGGFVKWLVASPEFISTWGKPTKPEALAKLPFVAMSALVKPLVVSIESRRGARRTVRFSAGFFADTSPTCRAATLAGGGVAFLTDFSIGDDVAEGRLVRLLPEWSGAPAGIHAVFPSARQPVPKVRVFIDALKAHLAGGVDVV
ncbi:LysR family transcriptional regulator [Burkholderia sp. PAMC 28687]|jgi:DNA-binding transcriptional LysR family regulator|uniref:LysR family transcriptional regulator n=1 Tax=Burkholderia sp. PAMC 28687 TaxID=1795874 RepID=UPI00078635BF|nr:LysR family transcriptional regulator [Burkholderia sp. PAMC 28687]AMM15748.1 LysR family transcriptional regulator [Burkholderia sp. PAMC 28687]